MNRIVGTPRCPESFRGSAQRADPTHIYIYEVGSSVLTLGFNDEMKVEFREERKKRTEPESALVFVDC